MGLRFEGIKQGQTEFRPVLGAGRSHGWVRQFVS